MSHATETAPAPAGRFTLDPRAQLDYLLREWTLMTRPATFTADALSAIAVALVALPLSLAIANASGVPPKVGLVTAIVGGVVAALFGGCRLQVSGPAAAMTLCPHACPIPGSASYSARTAAVRPLSASPQLASTAVSRP